MAKQIMDIDNSPLFTELTSEEAANVNGGFSGGFDWQGQFYNPMAGQLFGPEYYQILQQQEQILGGNLLGILGSGGGNTEMLNYLFGQVSLLT